MITLGIDLSSSREGTAASIIEWKDLRAVVHEPELRCDDNKLDALSTRVRKAGFTGLATAGYPHLGSLRQRATLED